MTVEDLNRGIWMVSIPMFSFFTCVRPTASYKRVIRCGRCGDVFRERLPIAVDQLTVGFVAAAEEVKLCSTAAAAQHQSRFQHRWSWC